MPKGVINTHRMLCSNQQSIAQVWPFVEERPPVFVDWLPWNHTFGGNKTFNLVLRNGGTLYIDHGKALPGAIEKTVANLREISPTIYWNVPKGYDVLLPYLEADRGLRDTFFRELDLLFYAAAALPQNLWTRLEKLSLESRGELVPMASGWGSTETSPCITMVHYPISQAGIIGNPMPGIELKMIPNGGKMELRVRGPNVTPGYYRQEELSKQAFDEDGFFMMGDAGKFVDPDDPAKGILFDGRVTEDFKLTTGTWVHVGGLRVSAVDAAAPLIQDAVVTGHNRDYLGLLVWPNLAECRKLAPGCGEDAEALCEAPEVVAKIREALQKRNAAQKGSSTRIERVVLMAEPPSLDANEITDKGYINQRATLDRRAALVEKLYQDPPARGVIVL
jgi:feruloyl-CoA synthase